MALVASPSTVWRDPNVMSATANTISSISQPIPISAAHGLNIGEFVKKISIVKLSKIGVEKIYNHAITLSEFEGLRAHTLSIKSRTRRN